MSQTWDQESTKMAPEKRACSGPELYSDFTVCTELQHLWLKWLTIWWLIRRRLASLRV